MRLLPPLQEFDSQIGHYKALQESIGLMPASITRGWLKLDAKPAKQALSTWATKWMFGFTQQLQDTVVFALEEIAAFMREVQEGLTSDGVGEDGAEDDKAIGAGDVSVLALSEKLIAAITHIHNVREADEEIEEIFEPMRGSVAMLKRYGITLGEHTMDLLERCPFEWEDTKKLAAAARERLAPLHILQVRCVLSAMRV